MYWSKNLTKSSLLQFIKKPRFTGQYTRWDTFGQKKRKTNLIGTSDTKRLKFALLKSPQFKSTKLKISCDRMDT